MDKLRIRGGRRLEGEVRISGAKNAALPIMCAALLTDQPLRLSNVPQLMDVRTMAKLLRQMGVGAEPPKDGRMIVALEEGASGIAPIIRALDEAKILVQDLHLVEPSLDDVFLEKTGRHLEGADEAEPERKPKSEAAVGPSWRQG